MAYNVIYKSSVHRDIKHIDRKDAKILLDRIEVALSKQPDTYPVLKGEFAGLRKLRVGDYRAIYAIVGNDVMVLRVSHRKDVYK